MSLRDKTRIELTEKLAKFEHENGRFSGLKSQAERDSLVDQLVDSVRRVQFVYAMQGRDVSVRRSSPHDVLFDPLRAAVVLKGAGRFDEACWLVFLSIHCGRHRVDGWKLVRDLYAGDGPGAEWTWQRVASDPSSFRQWLEVKNRAWAAAGVRRRFGNHRRREHLSGESPNGTGAVVESYVRWVEANGGHEKFFADTFAAANGKRDAAFESLYQRMTAVRRFGRLGRFDYLCMLGKLRLANIEPGTPYLRDSSGPLAGAKLLTGIKSVNALDEKMARLGLSLGVGMQVIEDALCNWQKSPDRFLPFRG